MFILTIVITHLLQLISNQSIKKTDRRLMNFIVVYKKCRTGYSGEAGTGAGTSRPCPSHDSNGYPTAGLEKRRSADGFGEGGLG